MPPRLCPRAQRLTLRARACDRPLGIGFYTHHKYQKAVSAGGDHGPAGAGAVDAHGRAIRLPADGNDDDDEEGVPLTALRVRDEEAAPASSSSSGGFLGGLFAVRLLPPFALGRAAD